MQWVGPRPRRGRGARPSSSPLPKPGEHPVRRALISDIHANLEALEVVLDDIKEQGVAEIYCLGDIIGYGPNPRECIDRVIEHCSMSLLGNHDQGALFDPDGFNIGAERAIFWTREQLENPGDRGNERRWDFLSELPRTHRSNSFLFVHGSPRNPLQEYIFPEDIYNHRKMERLFQLVERYCFQGHTHVPGIFTESYQFFAPDEIDNQYTLGEGKVMVNVGSVGQPRDGDPRACYVILEDGDDGGPARITYRRVPYDFETTIQKIYAIPELDSFLGDRLRQGR
jgi:diadenosine tetraphosphatase ApaH/serine/threonine PP2A family protein phosphatase